jgi:hypothetical protein
MSDFDWNFTDEELAKIRREDEEFYRKNPNHPRTLAAMKYRAEHPEQFQQAQAKAGSSK